MYGNQIFENEKFICNLNPAEYKFEDLILSVSCNTSANFYLLAILFKKKKSKYCELHVNIN